ncbi:GSCFA family protein [Octadecabacter temperatus]|uniref:GSCFA family protein n=1 Tax=Octadecabacter temperatus TaxID=1458307 RepID=A0A0K0YA86_9RHOB|nr:GSCFA domain-containing protein [Octadecabacter temperatus]AKS47843.1 GSCFA family protein [Octadecabacter temperatus]SIO48298.1 GSCFA family protein [Octadecabacter temperatus]
MSNPYKNLPDHCFWSRAHRVEHISDVDPVVKGGFLLKENMKIATAGSCFAQHIARHLQKAGYNYFVTEEVPHPIIPEAVAASFGYGVFSARYGNLYTARQLLQLAKRAYGEFTPEEDFWRNADGYLIDPFRPSVQPGGFVSEDEFYADREVHFAAVRRIVEESDVFVFTFGLTEAWRAKSDGAVFALAPGVAGGLYSTDQHEFVNFSVDEIVADFEEFVTMMRSKNPNVKILMTVSPVPLIATAREDESVLSATSYSKSVLRVAVEQLRERLNDAHYFPSYEVITGNYNRGAYYSENLRDVEEDGVSHAMSLFMKHYTEQSQPSLASRVKKKLTKRKSASNKFQEEVGEALAVICDEELIEKSVK